MLLWFIGTAVLTVRYVFTDPRFDYRLLVVGALLPDVIDIWSGRARWAHSLTIAVGVLVVVMVVTAGRKPVRRLLLGLPIGMLLHLVYDGAFASTRVFWWPLWGPLSNVRLPSLDRSPVLTVAMEVVGAAMLWWGWKRFGLSDPARRSAFVRHGTLNDVVN